MKTYQDSTGTSNLLEQYDPEECQSSEATWLPVTWQAAPPWNVPLHHRATESMFHWLPDHEPAPRPDCAKAPISSARDYIEQHYREKLSLEHLAEALRLPVSRLDRLFAETTGIAFHDYVAGVRVEKAKNLLLNPNYYFTEIAFELGFGSIREFNRVFTRMVGEPPNAYRQRLNCPRLR